MPAVCDKRNPAASAGPSGAACQTARSGDVGERPIVAPGLDAGERGEARHGRCARLGATHHAEVHLDAASAVISFGAALAPVAGWPLTTRYYPPSACLTPERFARAVQAHRAIETSLH